MIHSLRPSRGGGRHGIRAEPVRTVGSCLSFLSLLVLAACGIGGSPGPVGGAKADNVVIVSVDTLRADYLGTYTPGLDTSPNIDAFGRDAAVFTDAITQATSTLPSHMSLFYSVHTFVHRAYIVSQPDPKVVSPMQALREAGFATGAFVGHGQLRPRFGLDRGFDVYRMVDTRNIDEATRGRDRLADLHREVAGFLESHRDEDFFLFVHNYEPHWPYDPPDRFLEMYRDRPQRLGAVARPGSSSEEGVEEEGPGYGVTPDAYVATDRRAVYAAVVRYVDEFFGKLLETIDDLGLDDETLIVFLSDHGESLGERGLLGHNRFYTEQLRVPLIIRVPGGEPRRLDAPVQLIDVMPTVYSALGLEPPYPFMGKDLLPLLRGRDAGFGTDRIRFSENKGTMAVRWRRWKLIFNPERPQAVELYDLVEDPDEANNLADERPELARRLEGFYYAMVAEHRTYPRLFPHGEAGGPQLQDDVLKELRALGYVR